MKYLLLIILLTSCGVVPPRSVGEKAMSGIHVDMTTRTSLKSKFHEVQECTGLWDHGTFESLAIVVMPNTFPCSVYAKGCSGEFIPPNTIKLGNQSAWKHEVIHALIYAKYGHADVEHESELFERCV